MNRMLAASLVALLFVPCCFARLGETIPQIEVRYGKPLKGAKPEYPATIAGVYAKAGFQMIIGFYQGKSYYEKFLKLDPRNPRVLATITDHEREILLKANCSACDWQVQPAPASPLPGIEPGAVYQRSDGIAKAVYDGRTKAFSIQLLEVEKADEARRKQREQDQRTKERENLKGF